MVQRSNRSALLCSPPLAEHLDFAPGGQVKAKVYLGIACCDPHTRETLHRAFDDAWVHIEPQVRPRADIEASRFKVAEIVLRLAKNGCRDPSAISREVVAYWDLPGPPRG
jgi:hypothetical protein